MKEIKPQEISVRGTEINGNDKGRFGIRRSLIEQYKGEDFDKKIGRLKNLADEMEAILCSSADVSEARDMIGLVNDVCKTGEGIYDKRSRQAINEAKTFGEALRVYGLVFGKRQDDALSKVKKMAEDSTDDIEEPGNREGLFAILNSENVDDLSKQQLIISYLLRCDTIEGLEAIKPIALTTGNKKIFEDYVQFKEREFACRKNR